MSPPKQVPLLLAAAPDIAVTEVVVAQKESRGAGFATSLKIAGTGLGTSAKVTLDDATTLTAALARR